MAKTPEEKIAELEAAQQRIKDRLSNEKRKLRDKQRKADRRQNYLVGAVVNTHAKHDPDFARLLWDILDKNTTRKTDREFLGLPPKT